MIKQHIPLIKVSSPKGEEIILFQINDSNYNYSSLVVALKKTGRVLHFMSYEVMIGQSSELGIEPGFYQ